jgi:hypothetical protein
VPIGLKGIQAFFGIFQVLGFIFCLVIEILLNKKTRHALFA